MSNKIVIQVDGLRKKYHPILTFRRILSSPFRLIGSGIKTVIHGIQKTPPEVDGLTFAVPAGSVVGFLGNNGAGKTTTMKMISRLLRPDEGKIKIFELNLATEYPTILNKVGCAVGDPAFYSYLSGRQNLELLSIYRSLANTQISQLLETVGLGEAGDKKVSDYSTGMKKRLALACAILGKPDVLILDEPSAGMDPRGRVELRQLIQSINRQEHVTVFISSHELKELEDICDHLVIIEKGKMKLEGTVKALRQNLRNVSPTVLVMIQMKVDETSEAFLSGLEFVEKVEVSEEGYHVALKEEAISLIPVAFVEAKKELVGFFQLKESIEDIYFSATEVAGEQK